MKSVLSASEVITIAEKLSSELGFRMPDREKLLKTISQEYPIPVIIHDSGYRVWLDRYYIAYIPPDKSCVRYVYISKAHIMEEYKNYQEMKLRGFGDCFPPEIGRAFRVAESEMTKTGTDFCVFPKGRPPISKCITGRPIEISQA